VTLFRSVSSRGGSTYEPLRVVELAREAVAVDEAAASVASPDAAVASFAAPEASPVAAPVVDSLAETTDPLLVVVRFHDEQRRAYAGGPIDSLRALLSDDVVWHVPGRSLIAGEHRGIDSVLAYFEQRRAITGATLRVIVHGTAMVGDRVVQLAGGRAEREGRELTWETVGVFRVAAGRIAECWLVPFDQYAFDRIWRETPPGG
jgi:ketosteroid isomerase-like protein